MPADQGGGPHFSGTRLDVSTANIGTGVVASALALGGPIVAPSPPPLQFFDAAVGAAATDVADYKFYRNANYTGGTHGFVNGAVRIQTDVGAGTVAFEWGLVSILNDNSTDATQENVAIVGQTNKNSVGGAWAGVFQATDNRIINDPTSALIGVEIDLTATGTDVNNQRLGMDIVLGTLGANPAVHAGIGIRVNAAGSAVWETGILLKNINNVALEIQPAAAAIGINLVSGTFSQAAIRLARQQLVTFENTNTIDMQALGASDTIVKFRNAATEKVGLDLASGHVRLSGQIQNVGATATMGATLKKGSGAGNYTTASTTYVDVDATNLALTVTIPTGWKLVVCASGQLSSSTAIATVSVSLLDTSTLVEAQVNPTVAGTAGSEDWTLNWVVTGDGASHTVKLQYKTSAGADAALMLNSSATLLPTMVFTLVPSN